MAQVTTVFPEVATSIPGFDRFEPIPTVQKLKDIYLHGVDFRDTNGKPLKNAAFAFYIKQAISLLEHEFESTIVPTQYNETHDYRAEEYDAWGFIKLRHKPVISLDSVQFRLEKDTAFIDVPDSWFRLEHGPGHIQIAPTTGALGNMALSAGAFIPQPFIFSLDWPSFFRITYTAGFERDRIPAIISHLIGLQAAVQALHVAGDLILGPGISSQSIAMDGLSQNINSNSSSASAGYGARIKEYKSEIDKTMAILRRYYAKSIKVVVA